MSNRKNWPGLEYKALDLHVHSPASEDFGDKAVTAEDIVSAAIAAGLDGFCLADHNTADWVDRVANAAKGKPITVFPGLEISVTGGKEGPVHIIGIFEPGRSCEDLADVLSMLGLTRAKRGKTEEIANGDPNAVIDCIESNGGLAVLAHSDSSHGVLHDMSGQPRIRIVQNRKLAAAEASKPKYIDKLDGSDPNYKRHLAAYRASDAHCPGDIGKNRTFFKADVLTLESLRQCFFDPEVRIRPNEERELDCEGKFPRIIGMSVDSGFFESQDIRFHPCQNTLIGGQGVGKSLLIEFLRFALDQTSTIPDIARDTQGKLNSQLGVGGQVFIDLALTGNVAYRVTRTYDGVHNPLDVRDLSSGELYHGDLASLFPIMAYSQTEAVYTARSQLAQMELIDKFIDTRSLQREIDECLLELQSNDGELVRIIDSKDRLAVTEKDIQTVTTAISVLDKSLTDPILSRMRLADRKKAALEGEQQYHGRLLGWIQDSRNQLPGSNRSEDPGGDIAQWGILVEAEGLSKLSCSIVDSALASASKNVSANEQKVIQLIDGWKPEYQARRSDYDALLQSVGGDLKALEVQRKTKEQELTKLQENACALRESVELLEEVLEHRKRLLDRLDAALGDLSHLRSHKCAELTNLSNGRLFLGITKGADNSEFSAALQNSATGTRIRKTDLARIAEHVTPRELIDLVLDKNPNEIAQRADIDLETADKLVNWLLALEARDTVLGLQHQYLPKDLPSIRYMKEDGGYAELGQLSVGQKCTALLILGLSTGNSPVIIDQPEESIDIASVFADIVTKLRSGKDRRQFILTTHNPNIAVTADSDLIHVLRSSATRGRVVSQGVIEDKEVRSEVIQHLEGGRDPYLMRGQKYGLLS